MTKECFVASKECSRCSIESKCYYDIKTKLCMPPDFVTLAESVVVKGNEM